MTYVAEQLERAKRIKAARAAAQAVETVAEAQAAFALAQARYESRPTSGKAYDVAAARGRVTAAQVRANANFQTLAEFAATPGGQEYMNLPPDRDLMQELRRR